MNKDTTASKNSTSDVQSSAVERLVMCGYECDAGPLDLSDDFKNIIEKADLWIVVKRGVNISHTSGNGGVRFTACTNKEEAEWLANLYNKEKYGGRPICSVARLLDT